MDQRHVSRRRLLGAASAAGIAAVGGGLVLDGTLRTARTRAQIEQEMATPVALGEAIPPEFGTETNWPYENADLRATRVARGTSISTSTIGQLGDAWSFPVTTTGSFGPLTANPTVAGDLVYVQDAEANVYALDKASGEQVWANMVSSPVPTGGPNGVAIAYDMAYYTDGGPADVVAARADTGEEVWRTNIQGPRGEGITTALLVYDSVVYVSTVPGDVGAFYKGGFKGVIHALDASNGAVLWYFDTTTDNLWGNPRLNSGGGFWHPPSVDDDGHLYVGIGNPAPFPGVEGFPNGSSRPGDNDYTNCILKINPETGGLDWYYNVMPHDIFDWDNQLTPVLADVSIGGADRQVVFTSGKHGLVVCLDRGTGEVLWNVPVGKHMNDDIKEIPEGEAVEVWPAAIGGVETPMAFADGKIICAVINLATWWTSTGFDPDHPFDLASATGVLVALNAADGSTAWETEIPTMPLAGATVTNDVVFSAGLDGLIRGYSLADGLEVFRYQAPAGVNTSPAVSGDTMYWAAGAFLIPSSDNPNIGTTPAPQVIALKLGGTVQASPAPGEGEGTPAAEATPPEESAVTPNETQATPESGAAGQAVQVEAVDIAFVQTALTIPANTDVPFHIVNNGAAIHNFTIDNPPVSSGDVQPGQSADLTVNLPAGTYQYYCSIPGHREAGMVGTLTVQ
jgi:outer membrane protein assembly factor BamB/plastocyanin